MNSDTPVLRLHDPHFEESDTPRYTTAQVKRIACVTVRQLQWWDEAGLLSPIQCDHQRLYEPRQAFQAMLFRELRERGFSLADVRDIWQAARRQGFQLPDETRSWMLTDGKRVVFLSHPDVVLAFLEQRRNPVFVLISLAALAQRMTDQCALFGRRGPRAASRSGAVLRERLA
jgi:DNA-binding transcriptional MerR regulator